MPSKHLFPKISICLLFLSGLGGLALAAPDEKPTWNVDEPPGPHKDVSFKVNEGTWMNLDVSPDGKTLIFDLLGDIYSMPIGGGKAKALTQGFAWDMQPKFSPDGAWIAFTSDRGGGDNIWVMRANGKDARAVSSETFRLLNSPDWSPDGRFIVGRKHFTSTRSIGSGELWMYHFSGGNGIQLNKKPNKQKDLGEPAFSPDGRTIYFSQDTTRGGVFQYNKDPNPGIYSIKSYDLDKGQIKTVLSVAGGSVRPTPSPDGRYLAYVRRWNYATHLFLYDLKTGEHRSLYDKLDRDLQETWAIHGVYPAMSWTPNGQSLVFWAAGHLHRLNIADGQTKQIPFEVEAKHRLTTPLRFPVNVHQDEFDVKVLRWVQVSPKGDKVIYQALGQLYVRDLPNGTPKRLTNHQDLFEFYPSFSRDGRWIVYTTWEDRNLGQVMVMPASGGESRAVTSVAGHYIEPTFSPDGKDILFTKVGSGPLRTPKNTQQQGIYQIPVSGGTATRVLDHGSQPQFGADSERFFYRTSGEDGKFILKSANRKGHELRTHAESTYGTDMRISPDGQWLAFTEHYNAHIVPFVLTGKTLNLSPKTKALPVKTVSRNAGEYIHWSGDNQTLYWSLGNQLFSRDLKDAFDFLEGSPDKLPEASEQGRYIGFKAKSDRPEGLMALIGGTILTMKGDEVIENGVILVRDNRIVAVGPADKVDIPADANRIDTRGHTLMPGIVDVHAHGPQGSHEIIPKTNWHNLAGLTFGVTTIHDPSNDTSTIFAASELAKAGQIIAPRIYSTGTILYGAKGPGYTAKVESEADAAEHLKRLQQVGAISVKSYNQPRRDQRQKMVTAARKLGMMVVPEGGSLYMHNMTQIVDGHTGIEHTLPLAKIYDDTVKLWAANKDVYFTPTIVVGYGGIWGEEYWYDTHDVWKDERLSKYVPPYVLGPRARRRTKAPLEEYNHFRIAEMCKKLSDAGVKVNIGAHGQREGLGAHWEMWMLGQGGMKPLEVLRCATINGAEYLGFDKDIGTLEKGKLADILILEKSPLEDLTNSRSIRYVLLNGRLFDAADMKEIGHRNRVRQQFFWEWSDTQGGTSHMAEHQVHTCGCTH